MTALGSRVVYTYSAVGDYTAVVTATNGTNLLTDTTNISVIETPISGLTASNDSPTELGESTTLTATITGGDNVNYMWDFGDGKSDSEAIVTNIYPEIGTYTATVTATNSTNSLSANTTVTIQEWQPGENIYVEPAGICGGLSPCFDKIQDAVDAAFDQNEIFLHQGSRHLPHYSGCTEPGKGRHDREPERYLPHFGWPDYQEWAHWTIHRQPGRRYISERICPTNNP
jgi:hypothetical protein